MDGSQGRPDGQKNVLGGRLDPCSHDPVTGFFRDGCCHTGPQDRGLHTVCAVMTDDFLAYSKSVGNALSTPICEGLLAIPAQVEADIDIRCVVITGAGEGFCSGADLKERKELKVMKD